jgi:hypothetical protein
MLVEAVVLDIADRQVQPDRAVQAEEGLAMLRVQPELLAPLTQAVVVEEVVRALWVETAAPVSSSSNTVCLIYLFMYSVEQLLGLRLQVQPRWITW